MELRLKPEVIMLSFFIKAALIDVEGVLSYISRYQSTRRLNEGLVLCLQKQQNCH